MSGTAIVASPKYTFEYDYEINASQKALDFLNSFGKVNKLEERYYSSDFPFKEWRAINLLLFYTKPDLRDKFMMSNFLCCIPREKEFIIEEVVEELDKIRLVSIEYLKDVIDYVKELYPTKPWLQRSSELYDVDFNWSEINWDAALHELGNYYAHTIYNSAIFYWRD